MPLNTLSPQAQAGFAYAATLLKGDGTPLYKNAEAACDASGERDGCAYYEQSKLVVRTKRVIVLEDSKNAALAAQVDALAASVAVDVKPLAEDVIK
jgi:hypothetical protein